MLKLFVFAMIACLAVARVVGPAHAEAPETMTASISVDGTEFVARLADGTILRSAGLVGAVLEVAFGGRPARIRLTDVERDPADKSGTVWLHGLEIQRTDGSWTTYCTPGPDGRRQGFPIEGLQGGQGFSCTSGAVGKCVRFGFRPWARAADDQPLAAVHVACVRMLRGDYGGDGKGWTRNGTQIDLYDHNVVLDTEPNQEATFEAGWSAEGAVCVHHARVKNNVTLAELEARYPRLKGHTGSVCTEEFARANGAILFNRSKD